MPESARLTALRERIAELQQLLPESGQISYTQEELDRTLAFRLLAHAELESCLEDVAIHAADAACKEWLLDQERRPNKTIVTLLAYHGRGLPPIPENLTGGVSDSPLRTRIDQAKTSFSKAVAANNGIVQKDVLKLLLPAGVQETDLNAAWLSTIHSFGVARGGAAHNTFWRVKNLPDPGSERDNVEQIVDGLTRIDEILQMACTRPQTA